MNYFADVGGEQPLELEVGPDGVVIDGVSFGATLERVDGTDVHVLRVGHRVHRVVARRGTGPGRWDLVVDGVTFDVEALDERTRHLRNMTSAMAGATGPKPIVAPMPGLVMRIEVSVGEVVEAGQGVAIVEAMKMENELVSESAGRVTRIGVSEGDAVDKGTVLVELESIDDGEPGAAAEEGGE